MTKATLPYSQHHEKNVVPRSMMRRSHCMSVMKQAGRIHTNVFKLMKKRPAIGG